jgi:single-strand DNA-binding protein
MAGSYNRIVLVGNLTRDPEIRYLDGSGKAVTKFALAINRKSKAGDETMFIDIVAWDRLGEICNQYLKKGMSALVEGRLAIRDYTNKDGEKRKAIEVVASDMQMLDSKGRANGEGGTYTGSRQPATAAVGAPSDGFDESAMEDEIPF